MIHLTVMIEIRGEQTVVGHIDGEDHQTACFSYDESYLVKSDAVPISISLPLKEEPFNSQSTKCFFDGLLPEGFLRRTVAQKLHSDENDYITILSILGRECLGAILIQDDKIVDSSMGYEKLDPEQVKRLAAEGASKAAELITKTHLSLTGASGKVGLYRDRDFWYLPKGSAPSTHIVKQSHVRLNDIVVNEQLSLMTANAMGIDIPESQIINVGKGSDAEILFATTRYDRAVSDHPKMIDKLPAPYRLHQEDFAQALGIPASEKYEQEDRGYLKRIFELIRQNSADPLTDQRRMWDRIIFHLMIGNTDAHIKNASLLYDETLREIRLAPAYDIISTAIYDESTREMPFFIGGEYILDKIGKEHLEKAAETAGIGRKMAMSRLGEMQNSFEAALNASADRLQENGFDRAGKIRDMILKQAFSRKLQ